MTPLENYDDDTTQMCDGCGATRDGTEGHWECVGDDERVLCPSCYENECDENDIAQTCDCCDARLTWDDNFFKGYSVPEPSPYGYVCYDCHETMEKKKAETCERCGETECDEDEEHERRELWLSNKDGANICRACIRREDEEEEHECDEDDCPKCRRGIYCDCCDARCPHCSRK